MIARTFQGREPGQRRARRRRLLLVLTAAAVAAVDLAAKAWAQRALSSSGIEAGLVDLRLAYNPGVAFSVAAGAPAALVIVVTAAITAGIAVVAWRSASASTRLRTTALAVVLGGALANVLDRLGDGVVTDYLHTGWWPTFNLADTAIVTGAALLVASSWQRPVSEADSAAMGEGSS